MSATQTQRLGDDIRVSTLLTSGSPHGIGAANIGDRGSKSIARKDADLIPDVATRPSHDNTDYHVGRGGAGNERIASAPETSAPAPAETKVVTGHTPVGLADKLKDKIVGVFKK